MSRLIWYILLLLLPVQFLCEGVAAQSTRVRGRVTDARTGEPIPLASVVFRGLPIGVTTDFEGLYFLETRDTVSALQVAFMGYQMQTVPITPHAFNAVDVRLEPVEFSVDEIVVTPGPNPALPILRNVIRNKPRNNPDQIAQYRCETYTKMELDLANIGSSFKNKRLQRNFGFVFEYLDTSAVTGKPYLPVMISEASAEYYHRKSPSFSREIIRASRISGIEEEYSLAQFTGHMHGNVNFYDNYIDIFNVRFASPLSESGTVFYKYFLVDSTYIDGRKTYKIRFHPKGLSTPVLDGEVDIDSATYALRSAQVKMAKGVNVNWVRHLVLETENRLVNDSVWFKKQDRLLADFSVVMSDSAKIVSFLGHRQIDYSNVVLGAEIPAEVLRLDNNVVIHGEVLNNDEHFWEKVRPYALSDKEKEIYTMVDSIKSVPLYQNIYTIVSAIFGGYYNTKYVGLGPYYKLFSFNRLEGMRFQLGVRTTSDFSKRVRLSGYLAYGTKDEALKGGGGVELSFGRQPTRKLSLFYKHDALQLGAGINALTEGNILSSILSRGGNERLSMVNQGDLFYEHEWREGFSNLYGIQMQKVFANRYVPMLRPDSSHVGSVASMSLRVGVRLSKDEMMVRQYFDKYPLGSVYPIITLNFTAGIKGVFRNDFEYYRLDGSIRYNLDLPPIGTSQIVVSGGKIFGRVPYPLLKLQEGNGTYFYDPYAFSCMNYYEFASDAWVAWFYEHHFKGFFLGKIPLMKRLKWREVFTFKGVYGTLSRKNNGSLPATEAILLFPRGMSSVSTPYLETGVGIENIFRLFRVDAIWRLTHRQKESGEDIQNFAVNFGVDLKF